ncbi:MAG: hypothetical protein V1898_04830 [Patescibacteria group bacterium]
MSKFFLFSKINMQKHTRPSTAWYQSISLNYLGLNILGLILLVVLFFSYIVLVNNTASDGFVLDGLETQVARLEDSNNKLEFQKDNLESMEHVASLSVNYNLQSAQGGVEYLSLQPATVALSE